MNNGCGHVMSSRITALLFIGETTGEECLEIRYWSALYLSHLNYFMWQSVHDCIMYGIEYYYFGMDIVDSH